MDRHGDLSCCPGIFASTGQPPPDAVQPIFRLHRSLNPVLSLPILLLLALQSGSCVSGGAGSSLTVPGFGQERVPDGNWGGERIGMLASDSGAVLEYDCAHGTIDEPLRLDERGGFDAVGSHVIERPGPQRDDQKPETRPARFSGQVKDGTMVLTVRLTDTAEEVGTFTLVLGREPRVTKCL